MPPSHFQIYTQLQRRLPRPGRVPRDWLQCSELEQDLVFYVLTEDGHCSARAADGGQFIFSATWRELIPRDRGFLS